MMEAGELPEGWAWATVAELGKVVSGGTPSTKKTSYWGGDIAWISPSDLTGYTDKFIARGAKSITASGLQNSSATAMPAGSVHFSSRAPIGYTVISSRSMTTNQGFKSLVPADGVFNEYIYYYFKSAKQLAESVATGTTFKEISGSAFSKMPVPLPPTAEQHRIVAKIEELFSELDQGVTSLKTAREQLKVYRQSLLKNAFEGKLTAAWRADHADQLETAAALQQRIAHERQARYQQQLADWQTAGQAGPKPKPPKPLPPLTAEELAELPELPVGWEWVKLGELMESTVGFAFKSAEFVSAGVRLLRGDNIEPGRLRWSDARYWPLERANEFAELMLAAGEIIIAMDRPVISSGLKVARVRQTDLPCLLVQRVARIKEQLGICTDFAYAAINQNRFVNHCLGHQTGTQLPHISEAQIRSYPIPVCSLAEQEQISAELDAKLSEADQLDQTLVTALQQAEVLRQAILKKAFCGQLVAQDENDEPAAVLLERIRAEKAGQAGRKTRRVVQEPPEVLELKLAPGQVIPFPVPLPGIAAKDLHAGILAMAYRLHEQHPDRLQHFGHVKAEKISHLVEAHLGLDLERQPFKDAAGPNDHPQLKKVEHRASKANWFDVARLDSGKYVFHPKSGFDRLLTKTHQALGARLAEVERLLELMLPMTMRQAEILATVYAAWNNLLLLGKSPSDEEIVTEARENWHESKLRIERDKFFTALNWMRGKGLIPSGLGRFVAAKGE